MQYKAPVEVDIVPAGQIEHVRIVELPKLPIGQDEIQENPKLSEILKYYKKDKHFSFFLK